MYDYGCMLPGSNRTSVDGVLGGVVRQAGRQTGNAPLEVMCLHGYTFIQILYVMIHLPEQPFFCCFAHFVVKFMFTFVKVIPLIYMTDKIGSKRINMLCQIQLLCTVPKAMINELWAKRGPSVSHLLLPQHLDSEPKCPKCSQPYLIPICTVKVCSALRNGLNCGCVLVAR